MVRNAANWASLIERLSKSAIELIIRYKTSDTRELGLDAGRPKFMEEIQEDGNILLVPVTTSARRMYSTVSPGTSSSDDSSSTEARLARNRSTSSGPKFGHPETEELDQNNPSDNRKRGGHPQASNHNFEYRPSTDKFTVFVWSSIIQPSRHANTTPIAQHAVNERSSSPKDQPSTAPPLSNSPTSFLLDLTKLEGTLEKMHHFLQEKGNVSHQMRRMRRAYKACPFSSLEMVEKRLKEAHIRLEGSPPVSSNRRRSRNSVNMNLNKDRDGHATTERHSRPRKRRSSKSLDRSSSPPERRSHSGSSTSSDAGLHNTNGSSAWPHKNRIEETNLASAGKALVDEAKKLFALFLPLSFTSAIASKYWGAVLQIVEVIRIA